MAGWMRGFIGLIVALLAAACAPAAPAPTAEPATPAPTNTPFVRPTLPPTFTPAVTPTEAALDLPPTPTPVLVQPLTGVRIEPPFSITLPEGWGRASDTFLYEELGDVVTVPFTLYQGPVSGGRGTILVLWNFRSVAAANPLGTPTTERSNWSDGLRLLRYPVFEPTCNIGTEPERAFTVGGRPATGTNFAAVDCPELPNTRGWFAGLTVNEIPFVFYVYTDPLEAMLGRAPQELQAILDSIVFQ
ncbi:hypothetical protein VZO05_14340 [Aggregatilineales bacterium SYSU G02658]